MKQLTIIMLFTLFACEKSTFEPQQAKTENMTQTTQKEKLNDTAQIKYVFEANCNIAEGVYKVGGKDYTFCGDTAFIFKFKAKVKQRLEIGAKIRDKYSNSVRLKIFVNDKLVADKWVKGKSERVYKFGSTSYKLKNEQNHE